MKTTQDLTRTCRSSVCLHSERGEWHLLVQGSPREGVLCSECEEQELHTNTMHQLCPSRPHEVVFILDYRVSGVSFRS